MKKIILFLVPFLMINGCQDELYNKPTEDFASHQGIYFTQQSLQAFVTEGASSTIDGLKLNLVNKENKNSFATIEYGDEKQLEAYNKENGTSYIMLPKDMYNAKSSVSIKPNHTTSSIPIQLKDLKFSREGDYALPIKIIGGSADVIKGQSEAILVLNQKIITKVLKLTDSGTANGEMFEDDFKVDQWTMEVMVNRSEYRYNNRAIAGTKTVKNADALDEIFTRFGDVTIRPNQLQIKTGASQIDIPSDKLSAEPNKWYMLSFVYDGKFTKVYVNGQLVANREIRTGKYGLTGLWISSSNELIREVRFWKTARTDQQIKDNVWKMVNPDDDGLLLYYPMNGKKLNRETGEITEDETEIWDWSKSQKNLPMPSDAKFVNQDNGEGFVFPPVSE